MAHVSLKTPLHAWHAAHGARLVDFARWSMPVQYTSIVQEHVATRTAVGLFDISHMGRLEFDGPGALSLLDRLVTRRVAQLTPGTIRYALVTNEQGGILDDVLVYHLQRADGSPRVLMVVNASNRQKIVRWINDQRREGEAVLIDLTQDTAMIAVQGPAAVELVTLLLDVNLPAMKYYTGAVGHIGPIGQMGPVEVVVSRTGYTGEDGCELWMPATAAVEIWQTLLDRGQSRGAVPVGLGARDTLRLEAAMPLYGHELSEQITPLQAGLQFAVQLEQHEFMGRAALEQASQAPSGPVRVGLQLDGRRVPREHYPVRCSETVVGEVTSGTFAPTLQRPIALAYVAPSASQLGTTVAIDIRGRWEPAKVVQLPFYSRTT